MKFVLSKILGYAIVVGSSLGMIVLVIDDLLVKLPQLLKIANSRNAYGISILSILLELFSFTSLVAYSRAHNFPFR